jgi:hypothetical protein
LWAAAVGIAAITVGSKRSGGGSISSATRWPSLYSIFLVVNVVVLILKYYYHISSRDDPMIFNCKWD